MRPLILLAAVAAFFLAASPNPAAAYIGPGAGIGAIGTVIALFGAILFGIVGFVWYPLKRLGARLSAGRSKAADRSGGREPPP